MGARSQLGINLMRLGQEDEPRMQLEMCYENGYRDAATVNTLRLLDSYKNFTTFQDDNTILRLNCKGSRAAAAVFSSGAEARHRHLREESIR